ncbi:MAG: hypothetical protein ACRC9V_02930 [Aeromonas sp.]
MLREISAGRAPLQEGHATAHLHLTKLTELDDIDAYLNTFEVTVTRELWDKREWTRLLAPFLTGKAQRAYFSLQAPPNEDYDMLKREILARVGLSAAGAAQQFHSWVFDDQQTIRIQAAHLSRLAHLWLLTGDPSGAQVAEVVVVDRL